MRSSIPLHAVSHISPHCFHTLQAEQSDEEEDDEEEEAYDYLSPFLPTLTGTQELNRDQVRPFIPLSQSPSIQGLSHHYRAFPIYPRPL